MPPPEVQFHRKPRRSPGLWICVGLAVLVHAGIGLTLFWDDAQLRGEDPTATLGAGPFDLRIDAGLPWTRGARQGRPAAADEAGSQAAATQVRPTQAPAASEVQSGPADVAAVPPTAPTPTPAPAPVLQASFDCTLARSVNEKLICSDPELARLDRELGRIYARAKIVTRDPAEFQRQTQEEWRQREQTCSDRRCLLAWYAHRRQQLSEVLTQSAPG